MPSNDLVLNVRQIASYPNEGSASPLDAVLLQSGGVGGPYYSINAQNLVGSALLSGTAPLQVGVQAPGGAVQGQVFADSVNSPVGGAWMWNCYSSSSFPGELVRVASGWAAQLTFEAQTGFQFWAAGPGGGGTPLAFALALTVDPSGYLTVTDQVLLGRDPVNMMEAATASWVNGQVMAAVKPLWSNYSTATVWSVNGRTGQVILGLNDIQGAGGAPVWSPNLQGIPTAPSPSTQDNSSQIATTQWVWQALQGAGASVDLSGYAKLASPNFSGVPTAPTAAPGSSSGQLATTAFVTGAVTSATSGVASFNTRTGAVVLSAADITGAGGALLVSPVFTGTPQAPTATVGTSTQQIASTAFVGAAISGLSFAPLASPAFTGIPTAPTAGLGTNTNQLASTAFVLNEIAALSGVSTFNGRTGAVSLIANDVSAASGALLAGPAFTGVPTAPTAAPSTNTTQLATCAFVTAAVSSATAGVSSFNTRIGAVTLAAADVTGVGGALLASPALTGTPTAPTAAAGTNTTQLATCAYVAGYLPLTGGVLTGALTPSQTAGIVGTNTNNSAAAGAVGEYVTGSQMTNVAVAASTNVNIVSISLTAGDWDVQGNGSLNFSVSGSIAQVWVATVSAGNPINNYAGWMQMQNTPANMLNPIMSTGAVRVLLSATASVFLVCYANFASGTCNAQGTITARRRR